MNYATIKPHDVANGTGVRVSLFVSGCTHHCKGCFNEVAWDFNYGNPYTQETEDEIIKLLDREYIKGLSLLGGEPMEVSNQKSILPLIKRVREVFGDAKTIWIYSGYTLEELLDENSRCHCDETVEILKNIDTLVDGEFVEELKDLKLKFRGSSNQRIIDMKSINLENKSQLNF